MSELQAVTLLLPRDKAETYRYALADLLCWISGFETAKPDAFESIDLANARRLLRELKDAIDRVPVSDLPF